MALGLSMIQPLVPLWLSFHTTYTTGHYIGHLSVYGLSPLLECKLHDSKGLSILFTAVPPVPGSVPGYVDIKKYLLNQ